MYGKAFGLILLLKLVQSVDHRERACKKLGINSKITILNEKTEYVPDV